MLLKKFYPNYYYKSIFFIDFCAFEENYDNIIFDYDNTLTNWNKKISNEVALLLSEISKKFRLFVFSNAPTKRIEKSMPNLKIKIFGDTRKPTITIAQKIVKRHDIDQKRTLFIGDNMITDIFFANRLGFGSVLVDPLHHKEYFLTKFWRFLEFFLFFFINLKDIELCSPKK